jgi:hypothetical protein
MNKRKKHAGNKASLTFSELKKLIPNWREPAREDFEIFDNNKPATKADLLRHASKIEEALMKKEKGRNKAIEFYFIKEDEGYFFNGSLIKGISEETNYFKIFDCLYNCAPTGGLILYKQIIEMVRSRINDTKVKRYSSEKIKKFIQKNLTDESNGFLKYAKISNITDSGDKLIRVKRGSGFIFNNKKINLG